jgi:hypothetical protein
MPPKRQRKPPTTIGKGKKGTLKRKAFKAGVGRKGLKTLRSLSPAQRKQVAASSSRARVTVRNIRKSRAAAGRNMTTGKASTNFRERRKGAKVAQRAARNR